MKLILLSSAIILAVCLAGCATNTMQGQKFDDRSVKNIQTGKTTKSEVIQMFGQPPNRQSQGGGKEFWMYQSFQFQSQPSASSFIPIVNMFATQANSQANGQMLRVQFTGDIVSDCTYSKSILNQTANVGFGGTQLNPTQTNNVTTPCNEAQ